MSAKRTTEPSDETLPAPPCYVPAEELAAEKRKSRLLSVDPEKVQISVRLGLVASAVGFVVWSTVGITGFMHSVQAFQAQTTVALAENKAEIRAFSAKVEILAARQTTVMGDRWRFSDQQPWAYQLEKANRDVLREDGKKGLVVPEPVAKPNGP
jgi:hypothetical protein